MARSWQDNMKTMGRQFQGTCGSRASSLSRSSSRAVLSRDKTSSQGPSRRIFGATPEHMTGKSTGRGLSTTHAMRVSCGKCHILSVAGTGAKRQSLSSWRAHHACKMMGGSIVLGLRVLRRPSFGIRARVTRVMLLDILGMLSRAWSQDEMLWPREDPGNLQVTTSQES